MSATERTRDHETDADATSENVLATLDEEQRAHVQMQQMKEATVAPGVLKLPVKRVTTSEERGVYAVELDHPMVEPKETRQFYDKPVHGWTDDYKIVRILDWYTGSENPHDLQLHHVYTRYHEEDDEWEIIRPPGHTKPLADRLKRYVPSRRTLASLRPSRTHATMFAFMTTGLLFGVAIAAMLPTVVSQSVTYATSVMLGYLAATILGMVVLEP